jgi:damage-control phosphatase, subfamily I
MKTYLDCIPCFFNQALRAGRIATHDEKIVKELLDKIGLMLQDIQLESTPPAMGRLIYQKIIEITGNPDPYKEIKKKSTQQALKLYPALKEYVADAKDKLYAAVKIAIAGNIIDFGPNHHFNLEDEIEKTLQKNLPLSDYIAFKKCLSDANEILYIGDNAGECVFDRILIEEINKPVIYAVRDSPVINDALYNDALLAGIHNVADIISSGTDGPGAILDTCNTVFKTKFKNASFIISKGQGNYEALSNEHAPIFFLLKAKCRVIADDIGVNEGDVVLKSNKSYFNTN